MSGFDVFGGGNTSGDWQQEANQERQLAKGYQPYQNNGQQAAQWMLPQLHQMLTNPDGLQDHWASGFQMSPYQHNVLNNVSQQMQALGANTGMLGSGQLQKALQDHLSSQLGQFQNDYVNRAMQLHNTGLGGLGNFYQTGFNALNNRNHFLDQANQAQLQSNINKDTQSSKDSMAALETAGEAAMIVAML